MKPHALLINCARGGVIDEDGAARGARRRARSRARRSTSSPTEPPPPRRHRREAPPPSEGRRDAAPRRLDARSARAHRDRTRERRRERPARRPGGGAVNAPIADRARMPNGMRPFVDLAYRIGRLYPQIASDEARCRSSRSSLQGEARRIRSRAARHGVSLAACLQATTDRRVSIVNAPRDRRRTRRPRRRRAPTRTPGAYAVGDPRRRRRDVDRRDGRARRPAHRRDRRLRDRRGADRRDADHASTATSPA